MSDFGSGGRVKGFYIPTNYQATKILLRDSELHHHSLQYICRRGVVELGQLSPEEPDS